MTGVSTRAACAAAVALWAAMAPQSFGEPASARFRVITDLTPTEDTRLAMTERSAAEPRDIRVPDAAWLQLEFGSFDLGATGRMTIADVEGAQSQTFTQDTLEAWGGQSAIFRSGHLRITTEIPEDEAAGAFYRIERILVGAPLEGDRPESPPGGEERAGIEESQCGANDDRQPSGDPRIGRIMPIGCTGWIVGRNTLLTAGHCVDPRMRILEFSIPISDNDGTTNPADVQDQYAIDFGGVVFNDDGIGQIGDDWAVFRVAPNTETGLLPRQAQGGQFDLSQSLAPNQVTIEGFGVDVGAANQTQQIHSGAFLGVTVQGTNDAFIEYTVDTEGGNSGSPVFESGGQGHAIGIHTNAGCNPPNAGNTGTSFQNAALWQAISDFDGATVAVPFPLAGVFHLLFD